MNDGGVVLGKSHILAARPLLMLVAVLIAILGLVLLGGGIYLGFVQTPTPTVFTLFGNSFSSTSIGVSMAFTGAVATVLSFRYLLKALVKLGALPEQ